jgi:hypothetical protein
LCEITYCLFLQLSIDEKWKVSMNVDCSVWSKALVPASGDTLYEVKDDINECIRGRPKLALALPLSLIENAFPSISTCRLA